LESGNISVNATRGYAEYYVSSIKDIINVIIPHFIKYPLITQKCADFLFFKSVVEMISRKEHLTIEGLRNIVSIKAAMNKGLTAILIKSFPGISPATRPLIAVPENIDPY
jgi:hypothetical protein